MTSLGNGLLRRIGLAFSSLAALSAFAPGADATIVLAADHRSIDSSGTIAPASPFAPFDAQTFAFEAGAGQTSSVDAQGAAGSGYAYAGVDALLYGSSGTSTFEITFAVTTATPYHLSGTLGIEEGSSFLATLSLLQGATALQSFTASFADETVSFDVSGVLTPGTYDLVAVASATPGAYGFADGYDGASFGFAFAVPEPATALLVSFGLLALALGSRRA